jgi:hypothetical protein
VSGLQQKAGYAVKKLLTNVGGNCGADRGTQALLSMAWREHPELDFRDVEFRNNSQNGEDGILLYLFTLAGHGSRRAIELCAGDGIENNTPLPPEITVDPQSLTETERHGAGAVQLSPNQADVIAALDRSQRMRTILGDPVIDTLIAVRRYEQQNYSDLDAGALADKFRMAWSL